MNKVLDRTAVFLEYIFAVSAIILLFASGLSFFAYLAAMFFGGDTAAAICVFTQNKALAVIIYVSSVVTVLGMLSMYLHRKKLLTISDKPDSSDSES